MSRPPSPHLVEKKRTSRLRELAAAFPAVEARDDFLNQARHYDVLASQAASRQLPRAA